MKRLICVVINLIIFLVANIGAYEGHICSNSEKSMHCPMIIKGIKIAIEKIENGMRITLTADKEELIKQIKEEAKLHQQELIKKNSMSMCNIEEKSCEQLCPCLVEGADMKVIDKDNGVDIEIVSNDKETIAKIHAKAVEIQKHCHHGN